MAATFQQLIRQSRFKISYHCQTGLKLNNPSNDSEQSTQASRHNEFTDQCFVVNLLPDELVLAEGVAGFSCDGVYGSLLHLLLHGTVKHEQRLPSTLLVREETEREELPAVQPKTDAPSSESFNVFWTTEKGKLSSNSGQKAKN